MAKSELITGVFPDAGERSVLVPLWQGRYYGLINRLLQSGSEVSRLRVIALDPVDGISHIHRADHKFVFPATRTEDIVSEMSLAPEGHRVERLDRAYDTELAIGSVLIRYSDAGGAIEFGVQSSVTDTAYSYAIGNAMAAAIPPGSAAFYAQRQAAE